MASIPRGKMTLDALLALAPTLPLVDAPAGMSWLGPWDVSTVRFLRRDDGPAQRRIAATMEDGELATWAPEMIANVAIVRQQIAIAEMRERWGGMRHG